MQASCLLRRCEVVLVGVGVRELIVSVPTAARYYGPLLWSSYGRAPAREVERDVRGQDLGQLAVEEAEAAARQDGLRGREAVVLVWAELRPHRDEAHAGGVAADLRARANSANTTRNRAQTVQLQSAGRPHLPPRKSWVLAPPCISLDSGFLGGGVYRVISYLRRIFLGLRRGFAQIELSQIYL